MSHFTVLCPKLTKATVALCEEKYTGSGRTKKDMMKTVWDYQVMLDEYMEKKEITQVVIDTLAVKPNVSALLDVGAPWIVPADCKVADLELDETTVYVHEGSAAEAELKKIAADNAEAVKRILKKYPLDVWVWSDAAHEWYMMEDYDTESDASSHVSSEDSYQGQLDAMDDRIDELEERIGSLHRRVGYQACIISELTKKVQALEKAIQKK